MEVTHLNSKEAITHFVVVERFLKSTLVKLKLETGRTHQIRVHMKYIKYPLVGDSSYGLKKAKDDFGQYLHACTLGFIHPRTKQKMSFQSPLPAPFLAKINQFKKEGEPSELFTKN